MTERAGCSPSCPFKGNGCYAENFPLVLHWNKVSDSGAEIDALCKEIKKLPKDTLWRHNVAGDLAHVNGEIDRNSLNAIVSANAGKNGYTYTHHKLISSNVETIKGANASGFTINASCESISQAQQAIDKGIPAVCVVDKNETRKSWKDGNSTVVLCPATYRDDMNCASCGACQNSKRKCVIAFPAHGAKKNSANKVIKKG
jgi:hypothetical protein